MTHERRRNGKTRRRTATQGTWVGEKGRTPTGAGSQTTPHSPKPEVA